MVEVALFTFNDFQENTYVVFDGKTDCVIFDPGCNTPAEEKVLEDFVSSKNLTPTRLINTHAHIDHILGNKFVADRYNLELELHKGEVSMLEAGPTIANMYQIAYNPSPSASKYIEEDDIIKIGDSHFKALLTPGHSPASLSFYDEKTKFLIAGDVLFEGSIGRTDLPGGDYDTLINSIKTKLLVLPDDVTVFPGHGPSTSIGRERKFNPFLT